MSCFPLPPPPVFARNRLIDPATHDAYLEAGLLPPIETHPRLRALLRTLLTIDPNARPSPRDARVQVVVVTASVFV